MNKSIKKIFVSFFVLPIYINCMSRVENEQKKLFDAIQSIESSLAIVNKAQKKGADINMVFNENPIHWINVDLTLNNGDTLIDYAARNGLINYTKLLLNLGANPNKLGNSSPFRKALLNGHIEIAEMLLESPQFNQETLNKAIISLVSLSKEKDENFILKTILFLIHKGANINYQNEEGITALMWAANINNANIVKNLITHDAIINLEDKCGRRAIDFTTSMDVVKNLLEYASQDMLNKALMSAITYSNSSKTNEEFISEKISFLLYKGADINYQDDQGFTPLMNAITMNNLNIVKILVKNGAKYSLTDKLDRDAFDIAKSLGRKTIPKYMKKISSDRLKEELKRKLKKYNILPIEDIQNIICSYL